MLVLPTQSKNVCERFRDKTVNVAMLIVNTGRLTRWSRLMWSPIMSWFGKCDQIDQDTSNSFYMYSQTWLNDHLWTTATCKQRPVWVFNGQSKSQFYQAPLSNSRFFQVPGVAVVHRFDFSQIKNRFGLSHHSIQCVKLMMMKKKIQSPNLT